MELKMKLSVDNSDLCFFTIIGSLTNSIPDVKD